MDVGEPLRSQLFPRRVCLRADRLPDTRRIFLQQRVDERNCSLENRSSSLTHVAEAVTEPLHPEHERGRSASLSLPQQAFMPAAPTVARSPSPQCPPPRLPSHDPAQWQSAADVRHASSSGPLASAPAPPPLLSTGASSSSSTVVRSSDHYRDQSGGGGNDELVSALANGNERLSRNVFDMHVAKHSPSPLPSRRSSRGGSSRSSHERPAETESGASSTSTSQAHEQRCSRGGDGGCLSLSTTTTTAMQLTTAAATRTRDLSRPRPVRLQAAGYRNAAVSCAQQESAGSTADATVAVVVGPERPNPSTTIAATTSCADDKSATAAPRDHRSSATGAYFGDSAPGPVATTFVTSVSGVAAMNGTIRASLPRGTSRGSWQALPLDAVEAECAPWDVHAEVHGATSSSSRSHASHFLDPHGDSLADAVERSRRQMTKSPPPPPEQIHDSEADNGGGGHMASRSSSAELLPRHEHVPPTPLVRKSVGDMSRLHVALAKAGLNVRSVKAPLPEGAPHGDPDECPTPHTSGPPVPQPREVALRVQTAVSELLAQGRAQVSAVTTTRRRRRAKKPPSAPGYHDPFIQ